jgi:hypothetical protein
MKVIFSERAFHTYMKAWNTWKCIWSSWQVWTSYTGVLTLGLCALESLEWVFKAWKCLYIWRDNYFRAVLDACVWNRTGSVWYLCFLRNQALRTFLI